MNTFFSVFFVVVYLGGGERFLGSCECEEEVEEVQKFGHGGGLTRFHIAALGRE